MTKDYGEILLESMSTLLEANFRALSETTTDNQQEEERIANLNTADPLINFLPNLSYEIQNLKKPALTEKEDEDSAGSTDKAVWIISNYNLKNKLLAIDCRISTSRSNNESESTNTGSFGIIIGIQTGDKTYTTTFDSANMFGNIYNFINLPQKLIVNIPDGADVKAIGIYCYNNTNDIDFTVSRAILSLGEDLSEIGNTLDPFTINCTEINPRYVVTDRGNVVINSTPNYLLEARYIVKDSSQNYLAITPANKILYMPNISVRWYRYIPNEINNSDEWGGKNWIYQERGDDITGIKEFSFNCTEFDPSFTSERYKAVLIYIDAETGEEFSLTSNIITIEKEIIPTEGFINKLKIQLNDNSDGVYPFYECDGYIKQNLLTEQTKQRKAICLYESVYLNEDNDINEEFLEYLDSIEWIYSPWSIIEQETLEENEQILESDIICQTFFDNYGYAHTKFSGLSRQTQELFNQLCEFKYTISSQLPINNNLSKIECIISFTDGKSYSAQKDINLTKIGINGTDYTVITRLFNPMGELVNGVINNQEGYCIQLDVYDKENNLIELNNPQLKLRYNESIIYKEESDKSAMEGEQWYLPALTKADILDIKIILEAASEMTANEDNTQPVGRELILTETFAIPVCSIDYAKSVYQGPSKIIYNSNGTNPQYDASFIDLIPTPVNTINWKLESKLSDKSLNPEIAVTNTGKYSFTPIRIYDAKMLESPIYIQGKINEETVWEQPIIIVLDKYFSKIINEWNGSLQINEEGDYIMSSAYVAGGKNENNTFTGIMMGELGTIIDEVPQTFSADEENQSKTNYINRDIIPQTKDSSMIGLFGYMNGLQSFGFKSDGTAFIGPSGGGRINFDGNGGLIYSENFNGFQVDQNSNITINSGTTGTFFNLKDGQLITSNGIFRGDLSVNKGNLAGWKLDRSGLYRAREQEISTSTIYYYAGLNSNTDVPTLSYYIPFSYEIYDNYYAIITGENPKYYQSRNEINWKIPQYIDGFPVRKLSRSKNEQGEYSSLPDKLTNVYFDEDIESLEIDNEFFAGCKNLKQVYLPKSTYYIGVNAFNNCSENLNIHLEGQLNLNWAPRWQGDTNTNKIYYSSTDYIFSNFNNIKAVDNAIDTKMIRFYAGTKKSNPTMEEWTNFNEDEDRNLFLVADTGEAFMSRATIKKCTINSVIIGDANNNKVGELQILGLNSANSVVTPYYSKYSATSINSPDNFNIYASGNIFINSGDECGGVKIGNTKRSLSMKGSDISLESTEVTTMTSTKYTKVSGKSYTLKTTPFESKFYPALQYHAETEGDTNTSAQTAIKFTIVAKDSNGAELSRTLNLNYYSLYYLSEFLNSLSIDENGNLIGPWSK